MTINIEVERLFSQYSFREISDALFKASTKLKIPIAVWTLSGSDNWNVLIGKSVLYKEKPRVETLNPGFIINGFEHKGIEGSIFIESIFHFTNDLQFLVSDLQKLDQNFEKIFLKELSGNTKERETSTNYSLLETNDYKEEENYFRNITEDALGEISDGTFQKVILSRIKRISLGENFDAIVLFEKLSSFYKNAFTSLTYTPETGIWIGASPEVLISVEDNIFKTCALAGTQQYKEDLPLKQVPWTQKEIEEQAFVCRYIISCFKKIRLREYIEEGPKTVRAANLTHLRSDFSVDMRAVDFPHLASDMLDLLHPTSAVCGMPHKPAFDFIVNNEKFKRELYAGFLGPVNINNSTHLYVNLRCMKVETMTASLFAGVGITEDSVWEKEWQETEIKFKTLLNVLDS